MKQTNEKFVKKGVSLRPDQYRDMGEFIDLNRVGPFSQFIQDAVDEKIARIRHESNFQSEKKAS